jgi:hypothetical protein
MPDQDKEQEFRVTDKRVTFNEESAEKPKQEPAAESSKKVREEPKQKPTEKTADSTSAPPLPEANFLTLVFSLYTHAQIFLGVIPNPITQQPEKDLPQAKYNIDLLGILMEKTKGNLSKEEEQALEGILYELRMNYISMNK